MPSVPLALIAGMLTASMLAAQAPLEIGVDAAAGVSFVGPTPLAVSVPSGSVRVGIPVSGRLSIEPQVALSRNQLEDFSAITLLRMTAGVLVQLEGENRWKRGLYARPSLGLDYVRAGVDGGVRPVLGLGLGVRLPFTAATSGRVEVSYQNGLRRNGFQSSSALILSTGLSFFSQ